jgi:hypothetical protein
MTKKQSLADRQRLCEELLAAAEEHGESNGDFEYQLGDLEDLFRVAFSLLDEEQIDAFWNDGRVSAIVYDLPEYRALAVEIYGESGWDEEDGDQDRSIEETENGS